MDWAVGIVGAILAFSCIVLVHELGHYVLARWHGVRVEVFSLGIGPYLLSATIG
ncbi:MAG: site-2 protease family protein, partial [Planctomycetota bacterium]|nr:site-2 protease family protein [Planctomycetota bacterium]